MSKPTPIVAQAAREMRKISGLYVLGVATREQAIAAVDAYAAARAAEEQSPPSSKRAA